MNENENMNTNENVNDVQKNCFENTPNIQHGNKKKKIIIGVIAAIIAVSAACAVFAVPGLFSKEVININESDNVVLNASKNTLTKYFSLDNETFFSNIIGSKAIQKALTDSDYNPSITISGKINKYPEMPSIENTGAEATINIDKSEKNGNVLLKGFYNNSVSIDALDAYINDEYVAFNVPFANEKFFFNWTDLPQDVLNSFGEFSQNINSSRFMTDEEFQKMASQVGQNIISVIGDNMEIKSAGSEKVQDIDCDVYKIELDNQKVIDILKKISDKVWENEEYVNAIKKVLSERNPELSILNSMSNSDMKDEVSKALDEINIKGVEISFYISDEELVRFVTDIKAADTEGFIFEALFTGENELTDNVKLEMYTYKNDSYTGGIIFTDTKEKSGSVAKKEINIGFKETEDAGKEYDNSISFVTNYNSSNSEFDGYISVKTDGVSDKISEFNGILESDDNMLNVNFDRLVIGDTEKTDVSFGLKISESEGINVIDKQGAIDIVNEQEKVDDAFENIAGNLYGMGF